MIILDTARMRQIGGQLGSNPAGLFQDEQGQCFYVKTLESAAHACNEMIAARLYQLAGAPVLHYLATCRADQIATAWLPLEKKSVAQLSQAERTQAQHWLGVHAWTANWDVAGFLGDNQGVAKGTVLTLDVGGALNYRGMGDPKGKAFGTQVKELDTMRQDADNPFALKLFGDMTEAAIHASIRVVTQLSDESICATIAAYGGKSTLAEKMLARKADMLSRLIASNATP